jgi:opacity protein-like surface antigen
MKMKAIASGVLSLLMINSVQAEAARKSLKGFSVGVQLGYILQNSKYKQNFLPRNVVVQNVKLSKSFSGDGVIGGINISYGEIVSKYMFLGYEIKGDLSGLSGSHSEGNSNAAPRIRTNLKMKKSVGTAVRVGVLDAAVLPYFRAGVLISEWTSKTYITNSTTPGGGSKKKWIPGLELGLGVEYPLTYKVAISGEFSHAEYGKFHYIASSGVTPRYMKASFRPRTNAFMFRVRYRIC